MSADLDSGRRKLVAEVIALAQVIREAERDNGGQPVVGDATALAYQIITDEDGYRFKCGGCQAELSRYSQPHDCGKSKPEARH